MSGRWVNRWTLARAVLAGIVAIVLAGDVRSAVRPSHFADADDAALVSRGKQVYAAQCASCHGRFLQGQPLWRLVDADQLRRAPAQDGTGPGWRHSDEELFVAVRDGHFPSEVQDSRSRMPAFGRQIAEDEILAVLAFIKARWPIALRVFQAALNPGGSGRPRNAASDWRFPPNCKLP